MIGYPGVDQLTIGGRGFLRGILRVRGTAGHTGSRSINKTSNAIEKAADLVRAFAEHRSPAPPDPILDLSPKLTVTRIYGGESFSIVPDLCILSIDVRLTTAFDHIAAGNLVQTTVKEVDEAWPTTGTTVIDFQETWPAYVINRASPLRRALLAAAERHLPAPVTPKIAGPSNIGNFLAQRGIEATAGLGVRYESLHGTDERIDLSTVAPIQATYHQAILDLLQGITGPSSRSI
jgi:succinyl-diaminopimelate desuccinylase